MTETIETEAEATETKKGPAKGKLYPGRKVRVSFEVELDEEQLASVENRRKAIHDWSPREALEAILHGAIDDRLDEMVIEGRKLLREKALAEIAERERAASAELEALRAKRAELGRA